MKFTTATVLGFGLANVHIGVAINAPGPQGFKAYVESEGLQMSSYGSTKVFMDGSPCCHHEVDEHGYPVVPIDDFGTYAYAEGSFRRRLVADESNPKIVGQVDPRDYPELRRDLYGDICNENCLPEFGEDAVEEGSLAPQGGVINVATANTGTVKNLVLLIRFADHASRTLRPSSDYQYFFSGSTRQPNVNPTGSVKEYYETQSYGKLTLDNYVTEWIPVSKTEAEAAMGCSSLCLDAANDNDNYLHRAIEEALQSLDATVDFSDFDGDNDGYVDQLTVIHSGYGAEWGNTDSSGAAYADRIWSHKWGLRRTQYLDGVRISRYNVNPGFWGLSGTGLTRLGVVAHELGHAFSLPDLYDRNSPRAATFGSFGVMSNAWGADSSQLYPSSFSPWSKMYLGWITPTELTSTGIKNLEPYQKNGQVYIIRNGYPSNEYILVEARSNDATLSIWDSKLPNGIYIWHIDENMGSRWNNDQGYPGDAGVWPTLHNYVRLIQQDGQFHLEKNAWWSYDANDAYKLSTHEIDDITVPSLLSYEQMYKSEANCMSTGNRMENFQYSNTGTSKFTYIRSPSVKCSDVGKVIAPTQTPTTKSPTKQPTKNPTKQPTTKSPTKQPTKNPTKQPTTKSPTNQPTTKAPTKQPTTKAPTTKSPTMAPVPRPTKRRRGKKGRVVTNRPTPAPTAPTPPTLSPTPAPTRFFGDIGGDSAYGVYIYCTLPGRIHDVKLCTKGKRNPCTWNPNITPGAAEPNYLNPHYGEQCVPKFVMGDSDVAPRINQYTDCRKRSKKSKDCAKAGSRCFWDDSNRYGYKCVPSFLG